MEPEAGEEIEIDLSGEDETAEGSEAIFVDEQAPAAAVPETPVAEKSVPSEPEAAVTPPPKATPKPAAGPQKPRKEPSLWEKVADDTTLLGIVGAAILVILALLWALFSRSRSARDEFKESILMESLEGEPDQGGDAAVAASEEPDATTPDTETSFLSDFSPSAIDSLQDETSEADPLSEADVYIAYGRYRQAEELIRQAIALQPQRLELKQKLLEILFATRDVDAYTALARELADQGLEKKDPKGWERVLSMGAKLAPTAALFAAAAGGEEGLSTQGKSVAAGQPQPASPAAPQGGEETMGSLEDLDLDLGGLEDLDDLGKLGEEGLLGGKELDLDLDLADSGSPSVSGAAAAEASTRTEPEAAPDGEELRLSLDDLEDTVQGELPEEIDQGDTLNISLDEIPSLGPETVSGDTFDTLPGLAGGGVERDDTSLADLEKELGLDERADDGLAEAGEPGQVETLELPENEELPLPEEVMVGDEVDTKLDLAQAYLEMGDAEGARDILDEVLAEGSEKQKQEARKMLEQL
ncbi:MAG TPA: hypothetical protein ENK54_05135 [Thiotrichales bacterium]|nr:hypothetical protein [Thiotrichales bacterium]